MKRQPPPFPIPSVTADMIIFDARGHLLLIKRNNVPFQGCYALPGGYLDVDQETVEQCAIREALEETGLSVEIASLVGVYSTPDRDPRWHNVTAAYLAKPITMEQAQTACAGDDAGEVLWVDPASAQFAELEIGFDHRTIIADALAQLNTQ